MERKVLKVKAQTINDVKKVNAYADKSYIYEQQALEHSNNAKKWAETALSMIVEKRADTKDSFVSNRYDIDSVVEDFANHIFECK